MIVCRSHKLILVRGYYILITLLSLIIAKLLKITLINLLEH